MTTPAVWGLVAAPTLLSVAAVVALRSVGARIERAVAVARWSTRLGVVVPVVAWIGLARAGTSTSPLLGWAQAGASVRLDQVSAVMLTMVALLAVVIVDYSATYLAGDPRRAQFLGWICATAGCVEVLVVAGHLALFVVAWVSTSLSLHQLLVFYRDRPRARIAARKKFVVARIGDAFLIGAVALLVHHAGTGELGAVFASAGRGPDRWAVGVAAVLIAVAAALKSAQFPTHGWLVEVMETPTPVSALLHAGILNAGPFLAIRMAPVLEREPAALVLLIVIGGVTALFASSVLPTQTSVKVALGYSSAAHMGFMLMVCGLGVYPAAMLHLVAHSFYKAHAFLSSGSVIDEQRASGVSIPPRLGRPARIAGSFVVAAALYALDAWAFGVDPAHHTGVLILGAILVLGTTQLLVPALDSESPFSVSAIAVLLAAGVTLSYFTLETAMHHLLGASVPEASMRGIVEQAAAGAVFVTFAAAIVFQAIAPVRPPGRRGRAFVTHVRNGLYANALLDRAVGALRVLSNSSPSNRSLPTRSEVSR